MKWPSAFRDITVFAVVGAIVGLALGLLFTATDVVENPFTTMAFGIGGGAAASITRFKRWEH